MALISRHRRALVEFAGATALVVFYAFHFGGMGDYFSDARPGLMDLVHGHLGAFAAHQPLMGSFSLLVRLPFAAAAVAGGSGMETVYHWGCLPCLAAAAGLGVLLARRAAARGMPAAAQALLAALCVVNPVSAQALQYGHPEEILTAVLCAGAVLAALDGRVRTTAVLMGLAWATKQWAVLFAGPVLLALPRRRIAVAAGAAALAGLLLGPGLLADPHAFAGVQHQAASVIGWASPVSVWFADSVAHRVAAQSVAHLVDPTVARLTHPLILALSLALPLLVLAARRGRGAMEADGVWALFALLALLRCALDSADIGYYHVPLLFGLIAWDASCAERRPLRALLGAVTAYLLLSRLPGRVPDGELNAVYVALAALTLLGLAGRLAGRPWRRPRERPLLLPATP